MVIVKRVLMGVDGQHNPTAPSSANALSTQNITASRVGGADA